MKVVHSGTELTCSFLIIDENSDVSKIETQKFKISKLCEEDFLTALKGLVQMKSILEKDNSGPEEDLESKLLQIQKNGEVEVECINKLIDRVIEMDGKIEALNKKSEEKDVVILEEKVISKKVK